MVDESQQENTSKLLDEAVDQSQELEQEDLSDEMADESLDNKDESESQEPVYEHSQAEYKCFSCNKTISEQYIKKKVRCPYCGSKVIFKARTRETTVKAR